MSDIAAQSSLEQESLNPIIPAQIRIGVTGHRVLSDEGTIREKVIEVLDRIDKRLKESMPNGTPYQYVVISPLAEGADRIVADIILNRRRPDEADESILEVLLPVPVPAYITSFTGGPASVSEFHDLLEKASKAELLPPTIYKNKYLQLGQRVVMNCDILIAIWDGEEAKGHGGTQIIVDYARNKGRALFWIHSGNFEIQQENFSNETFEPFEQLDTYNGEKTPDLDADITRRIGRIISKTIKGSSLTSLLVNICNVIVPQWAKASKLASKYQKYYFWTGRGIYGLSALAVTTVTIQSLFWPELPQILFAEVFFMLAILGLIWHSNNGRWHRKWADYRLLVERLRALTYMRAAELECSSPEAPALRGDWVVRAFMTIFNKLQDKVECPKYVKKVNLGDKSWGIKVDVDDELRNYLIEAWLEVQRRFYSDGSIKNNWQDDSLNSIVTWLFRLTLVVALLHALDVGITVSEYVSLADGIFSSVAIIFPVFGAAINGIRVHIEFRRNAERYAVMAKYLEDLIDEIKLVGDEEDFNKLIKTAYEAMFQENIDWRFTFFKRRPELP